MDIRIAIETERRPNFEAARYSSNQTQKQLRTEDKFGALYVYQNVSLRLMSEKWSGLTGRYNETSGQLEILKKLFDQAVIGTLN